MDTYALLLECLHYELRTQPPGASAPTSSARVVCQHGCGFVLVLHVAPIPPSG